MQVFPQSNIPLEFLADAGFSGRRKMGNLQTFNKCTYDPSTSILESAVDRLYQGGKFSSVPPPLGISFRFYRLLAQTKKTMGWEWSDPPPSSGISPKCSPFFGRASLNMTFIHVEHRCVQCRMKRATNHAVRCTVLSEILLWNDPSDR